MDVYLRGILPTMSNVIPTDGCCAAPPGEGTVPRGRKKRLIEAFRALADPTRLEVFRMIATRGEPICVCEVTERLDVTQPTISYHLRILLRSGLVDVSRRGVWAYYSPRPEGLAVLRSFLDGLPAGVSRGEE